MLNITKNFIKYISDDIINSFEKEYLIIFPKDYKEFLLTNNGGFGSNNYFNINLIQGDTDIQVFYGLGINEEFIDDFGFSSNYSLYSIENNIRLKQNRFPKGFIPILTDSLGNEICISMFIDNPDYGKVYFWDHEDENPNEGEEPWMENMYLVANSFTEFMEKIHPEEE